MGPLSEHFEGPQQILRTLGPRARYISTHDCEYHLVANLAHQGNVVYLCGSQAQFCYWRFLFYLKFVLLSYSRSIHPLWKLYYKFTMGGGVVFKWIWHEQLHLRIFAPSVLYFHSINICLRNNVCTLE